VSTSLSEVQCEEEKRVEMKLECMKAASRFSSEVLWVERKERVEEECQKQEKAVDLELCL
jgi:hypothetical protein